MSEAKHDSVWLMTDGAWETLGPFQGWLWSLLRVLLLPVGAWIFFLGLPLFSGGGFFIAGYAAVIGMIVHFPSYCFLGMSLYLLFWKKESLIWEWPFAVPLGTILGMLVITVLSAGAYGEVADGALFIGGGYGFLTAAGACWSRNKDL